MFNIGVIGISEGWSSRKLAEAFRARDCESSIVDLQRLAIDLTSGRARCDGFDLARADALVIKKIGASCSPDLLDRLTVLSDLAAGGMRIHSHPDRIRRALDRLSCTMQLARGGIPIPPTVVTEDPAVACEAVRRFERAVLKPLYTSKARGMIILQAADDLSRRVTAFQKDGNRMIYVQKLVPLPGRDLGVVFLGGEFVGCYARVGDTGSWNTTTHSGGRYEAHEPSPEIVELARQAQDLFELDFTCVDIAQTADGPVVFEVSAFGGFRGLLEGPGIDAAALYSEYVIKNLQCD